MTRSAERSLSSWSVICCGLVDMALADQDGWQGLADGGPNKWQGLADMEAKVNCNSCHFNDSDCRLERTGV